VEGNEVKEGRRESDDLLIMMESTWKSRTMRFATQSTCTVKEMAQATAMWSGEKGKESDPH
jgi:hypothetical protein